MKLKNKNCCFNSKSVAGLIVMLLSSTGAYAFSGKAVATKGLVASGLTAIKKCDLRDHIHSLQKNNLSLEQAQAAEKDIENFLEQQGYFLAEVILDQEAFAADKLKFDIYEGFVDRIVINGASKLNPKLVKKIKDYLEPITKQKPLHRDSYERSVLLADELAGVEIEATLKPAKKVGAADVYVDVKEFNRVDGYVGWNNKVNSANGPTQFEGAIIVNSPEYNAQTTIAGSQASKSKRQKSVTALHSQNIGHDGLNVSLNFSKNWAEPNPKLSVNSKLDTTAGNIQVSYPIFKTLREGLFLRGSLGVLNSNNKSNVVADAYKDKIRPLRLNLHDEFYDRWYGQNILEAEFTKGLKVFSASKESVGQRSRAEAVANYSKLNLSFYRKHYFENDYSLVTHVFGQVGFNKMLSLEEFDFGGNEIGRGYQGSAISGDNGAAAKLELHRKWRFDKQVKEVDLYAFYDYGWVENRLAKISVNGELRKRATAASTGIGLDVVASKFFTGGVVVGKPLTFPHKRNIRVAFEIKANLNH